MYTCGANAYQELIDMPMDIKAFYGQVRRRKALSLGSVKSVLIVGMLVALWAVGSLMYNASLV
jgi:hypothetical protein